MAGGSWTTRHIVRDLPDAQREAYAQFHRSPAMMANVAVRNWRFLQKLGVTGARWFDGFGSYFQLRRVATCGTEPPTLDPDRPIVINLKVIYPSPGVPTEEQGHAGSGACVARRSGSAEWITGAQETRRDAGLLLISWPPVI